MRKVNKNTADIVKENAEGIDYQMEITNEKVHAVSWRISEQEMKTEEAERYSRCLHLKLFNLPEAVNETKEIARKHVFEIFGEIASDKKNKLGFLINTVLILYTGLDSPTFYRYLLAEGMDITIQILYSVLSTTSKFYTIYSQQIYISPILWILKTNVISQ